jgi:hypothetical protein
VALTITMLDTMTYTGSSRHLHGEVTFDTSYPTGGYSFTPRQFRFFRIDRLNLAPKSGYLFDTGSAGTTIRIYYGDNNAVAPGPLVEVPAATNLSTLSTVYEIWGS